MEQPVFWKIGSLGAGRYGIWTHKTLLVGVKPANRARRFIAGNAVLRGTARAPISSNPVCGPKVRICLVERRSSDCHAFPGL
jgi:hypothetical protein